MTRIFEKFNFAIAAITFAALILMSLLVTGNSLVLTEVSAENAGNQVSKESAVENLGNLPVYFEENLGQFHEKVRYFVRGTSGYDLFLTGTDAVYVIRSGESRAGV